MTTRDDAPAPLPDPGPEPHTGLMGRFRNYFLTGLIVTGPIAITLYLVWWFVTWVDGVVRPFIPTCRGKCRRLCMRCRSNCWPTTLPFIAATTWTSRATSQSP